MLTPDKRNEVHGQGYEELDTSTSRSAQPMMNVIPAQITAIHRGLVRVGIRMRVGERTDLRLRWPVEYRSVHDVKIGQSVKAVIPAHAVHLEAGYFRLGKRRWNRWIARIVLVESLRGTRVITVKIHNDQITLKSSGSFTGADGMPRAWDTVNVVVDPTEISLAQESRKPGSTTSVRVGMLDPVSEARVWLKAQVIEVKEVPSGKVLSLLIGSAQVWVMVGHDEDPFRCWASGMAVAFYVNQYEAWVKPQNDEYPPALCGPLYVDR